MERDPLKLRFDDRKLEQTFWEQHDRASLSLVRVAWCLGIGLYLVFASVLGRTVTHGLPVIHLLYYGMAIPVILLAIISTFIVRLDRWRHHIISITLLVSTVVVNAPFFYSDPPKDWNHSANILIICFTFTFVAIDFRAALFNALTTTTIYEFSVQQLDGSDWTYVLYSNTFFLSVLIVTGTAGYMLEKGRRGIFLKAIEIIEQRRLAEASRERSDELLHNILPNEVAAELKEKGKAEAKYFEQVTILFTDFKGFTEASQKLSPQELVEELNTCFKAFDHIITAHGIEKIKTIGDAYMAAGGLPVPTPDSAKRTVLAALEMQDFIKQRKAANEVLGKPAFEMRVGIHTGPVVAGIVGVKKFAYDIWGDTVNTASRMESSGEVGQVNISEATYALVKEVKKEKDVREVVEGRNTQPVTRQPATELAFHFTPRGKVQAKGKGEMEMYFVERKP